MFGQRRFPINCVLIEKFERIYLMKTKLTKNMRYASLLLTGALLSGSVVACGGGGGGDDDNTVAPPIVGTQRDRMGQPAVNTALLHSGEKDSFNQGDPSTDRAQFFAIQVGVVNELRGAVGAVPGFPPEDVPGVTPEQVVSLVNPDTLHLDLSQPDGFPNGRRLQDDTINPILGLVLNRGNVLGGGAGISDGIDTASPNQAAFPYAVGPNPR